MRFAHPQMLWSLLALVPALVAFFWWSARKRQQLLGQFVQARLLDSLTVGLSPRRQKQRAALLTLAVASLIVALARPQWGFDWEEAKQRGLDIVVGIDTSKSMLAEDIAPNRLARAKLAALDLVQQARSDRLGLVAFAGSAFLQCPLTLDDSAFRQSLEALDVNIIPHGGTALAEAIDTALTAFSKDEADNYKVLVLFTDGEDHDAGALKAARTAAKAGLRIFTIGIGTPEGELLRIKDAKGRADYIRDEQGAVVKSRLNETLLQEIAGATEGGFYLPLRGAKTIETLYQRGLAPLPKAERTSKLVKRYHEQFHWPLALAIVLLLLEIFLPERQPLSRREAKTEQKRAGAVLGAPTAAAGLAMFLLPAAVNASPASALRDYNAGQFESALKEYERLIARQKEKGDPRLDFNAGGAAYRATNYAAAIQHFTAVLASPDVGLQQAAYFNLGNSHYRQGEAAKDLDALQQSWETAIKVYQNAVALDKNDPEAAHNLDFVKRQVEQIIQLREAARRAKAAADEATRRREYHLALEIMQNLLQNNPAAEQFQDYVKKLKDIDDITTADQP